jgi:hypothetical protein
VYVLPSIASVTLILGLVRLFLQIPANIPIFMAANHPAIMKKAILALSVILVVGSISSCTKLYNCTCVTETTDTIKKTTISATNVYKQTETSKKLADAKCQQNAHTYFMGNEKNATTCTLEKYKN